MAETLLRLKLEGLGMLLIEQKLDIALELADDVFVLGRGEVVFFGSVPQLLAQPEVNETWVGVA